MDAMQRLPSRSASSVSTMSDVDSLEDLRPPVHDVHTEKRPGSSFDSPDADELDRMLARDEEEGEDDHRNQKPRTRPGMSTTKRLLLTFSAVALTLWLLAAAAYLTSGMWKLHTHAPIAHSRRITFDDARSEMFRPGHSRVDWTEAHGQDGMYLVQHAGKIELTHVNGSSSVFVDGADVHADQLHGSPRLPYENYWISADMKYVLFATDIVSNWRHSFHAKYWVHEVETKKTTSLISNDVNAIISYAVWSPTGHSLAYVRKNDLFVRQQLDEPRQVTSDGGPNVFNGIPDWVYEEEVFQTNSAVWWAPDSKSLAFLRTDEEAVEEYPLEFFIGPSLLTPELYPEVEALKYPKAGTANPTVSLFFYDLRGDVEALHLQPPQDFENNTRLITEVTWLGPDRLFLRETNRDSAIRKTFVIEPRSQKAELIEHLDVKDIDNGWFEITQNTHYIPANPEHGLSHDGYIDTVISDGFLHLGLFSIAAGGKVKTLTSGSWEVVSGTQAIDLENGLVYFLATRRSSFGRHLYSVSLITGEIRAVSDDTKDGYYDCSFSPGSGYFILQYQGPGLPWEKMYSVGDPSFEVVLQDNAGLAETLAQYDLPEKVYSTITIDGYELNTIELRPPGFDASGATKYPVLFRPYGGPVSQTCNHRFAVDWHSWLASDPLTEYLVVTVDGRGTGFKGRRLRTPVRGALGKWEANDQIEAAKLWKKKKYVDPQKFAIWGWSFGGFLTLKVLEAGSAVFQYGMAVAPVTDWRFYDSIYTERYMGTVEDNLKGYEETAITHVQGFKNATRFLVMHGTGDDNVHYQNTLNFVDRLNLASIENYDMHIFPDSDHSIYFHNANKQVFHRLGDWLKHAFGLRDPLGEDRTWKALEFRK